MVFCPDWPDVVNYASMKTLFEAPLKQVFPVLQKKKT